jgi:hypothetical protein
VNQKTAIQVQQAPSQLTDIDKFARALCQTFSGDADRLMDGLFTLPYRPITPQLDPNLLHYFDFMMTGPDGQSLPQVKHFRFWGYQVLPLIEELIKNGLKLSESQTQEQGSSVPST